MPRTTLLVVLLAILLCAAAFAGPGGAAPGADLRPLMTRKAKLVFSDEFSSQAIASNWRAAKGAWTVVDGALKGVELAADNHAASIRTDLAFDDAAIQFDFQFNGGTLANLSINGRGGHLCRVVITPDGFTLRKDGSKKDKSDRPLTLDQTVMKFQQGRWYTMLVEIRGDQMLARIDDTHFTLGGDAKVDGPKTNFGFPSKGDATFFDNVKIWQADANPDWPAHQARLLASRKG